MEDNTPMSLCEVFEKKSKCKKVSYCTWNEIEDGESTCVGKACEEMSTEKDCKWDADCRWENNTCKDGEGEERKLLRGSVTVTHAY